MTRKPTHGGPRENAGRKATVDRPHTVSVKLSDGELQWLDRLAKHWRVSRAEVVRRALEGYTT